MSFSSCLYAGTVLHHRFRPKQHRFSYSVVSMLVDLDEINELGKQLKFFSINRFNLFSWHNKDHGNASEIPLSEQIRTLLKSHELDQYGSQIKLLCYPRMFGYAFNPLSVYYCYDSKGDLGAMLYEVHNTFNERHTYLINVDTEHPESVIRQRSNKAFYVSPFMPMDANYQFRMKPPENRISVCIRQSTDEGSLLHAIFTGRKQELSDRQLLTTLVKYPLMTLKVIAGIHWEALRLWRKGAPLQMRVASANHRITIGQTLETPQHETL